MKIEGNCHCGKIAFEAEVNLDTVAICHCTDCQMLTGSVFRANVPAPAESFRILRGEPRIYIKTADSGNKRAHAFCSDCGTPIYAAAPSKYRDVFAVHRHNQAACAASTAPPDLVSLCPTLVDGLEWNRKTRTPVKRR
jgi:hypothetical protein